MRNKKGQTMEIPFQMIFSIILIAVAMFVAFWAIRHFMATAETAKIGTFVKDIESQVKSVYNEYEANMTQTFTFSDKFAQVCFVNLSLGKSFSSGTFTSEDATLYFDPIDNMNLFLIGAKAGEELTTAEEYGLSSAKHIDCYGKECLNFTTPTCFYVTKGKVTITFVKGEEGIGPGKIKIACLKDGDCCSGASC